MEDVLWGLLRATQAAALAAAAHVGRGDKLAVDRAATLALRAELGKLSASIRVVVGEGEKDHAPGLFQGEILGQGGPEYDLAVDPVDGTTQAARGGPDALCVLALGPRDGLLATRSYYMRKLAVGPKLTAAFGHLRDDWLTAPTARVIEVAAEALGKSPAGLRITLLDRPRHAELLTELRALGCEVLLCDCDVASTVATALSDGDVDLCLGVGGAPEAVLSAVALRCLGGALQGMLIDGQGRLVDGQLHRPEDLARGEVAFAATGVTGGIVLRGVKQTAQGSRTHSLLLDSASGAAHWIESTHRSPVTAR